MMWIFSIALIVGFMFLAAINAAIVWRGLFKKEKVGSWIPLAGGIFGAVGIANLPAVSYQEWWWVPLLVDLGSLPAMVYMAWRVLFIRPSEPA